MIHFLSISGGQDQAESDAISSNETTCNFLSLLSVTDDGSFHHDGAKSVQRSRVFLSKHLKGGGGVFLGAQLALRTRTDDRYPVESKHLVDGDLPLLDVSSLLSYQEENDLLTPSQQTRKTGVSGIRELVIPTFDSVIQMQLSSCPDLSRPKLGLYQWPTSKNKNGLVIRPLPSATEDRELSPPSLVFQCDNLVSCVKSLRDTEHTDRTETALAKVGFSGCGRGGQYMIRNKLLKGLDIRICETTELSSSFAEAQEALLAASLDELQSVNVLNEGSDDGRKPVVVGIVVVVDDVVVVGICVLPIVACILISIGLLFI